MTTLEKLVLNLLDDDEGISSEAYSSLLELLVGLNEISLLEEVNNRVKSSNGRYYFLSAEEEEWEKIKDYPSREKK